MKFKLLIIPYSGLRYSLKWEYLQSFSQIASFKVPEDKYLLQVGQKGVKLGKCLELVKKHYEDYDYVIGECTGAFLWSTIFRLAGCEVPFAILPHFNHVSLVHAYSLLLSSQLALPCDIIFAGSETASHSFSSFGFHCDPLFPLGIELNIFKPLENNKVTLRKSLGLPSKASILLYAGRVQEDKNVLELLDVYKFAKQVCEVHLVICSHRSNIDYLQICTRKAEAIGGVSFVHNPDYKILVQYYNAVDLFVSVAVSDFETFGRSPLEAIACGTPVVVTKYDGFRDTISPEYGILVPTIYKTHKKLPDVNKFAEEIILLLKNKTMLCKMSRRGLQYIQRFDRKASLKAMLAKLKSTLINDCTAPIVRHSNFCLHLQGYPSEIELLWSSLEGEPIDKLLEEFLLTWKVPIQPSEPDVQRFHKFWFFHY